jgi:hypothetical protein
MPLIGFAYAGLRAVKVVTKRAKLRSSIKMTACAQ